MKKTVLCTFVLSWASMANSACLTSACQPNEKASAFCVKSNNLCKVKVLSNRNAACCYMPVPQDCSCHNIQATTHCQNPGDAMVDYLGIGCPTYEDCAYASCCDTVCSSCEA